MVGRDDAGNRLLAALDAAGVGTATVRRSPSLATGLALIMVDDAAENTIVVIPAANGALSPDDLDPAVIGGAAVVLLQLEIPVETVEAAVGLAPGQGGAEPGPGPSPARGPARPGRCAGAQSHRTGRCWPGRSCRPRSRRRRPWPGR